MVYREHPPGAEPRSRPDSGRGGVRKPDRRHRKPEAPPTLRVPRVSPPSARSPIVDLGQALERISGNAALLERLAAQLGATAPVALAELTSAVSRRDVVKVCFLAHRFAAQAGALGARAVVGELEALENAGVEGRWSDADQQLHVLAERVGRMVEALAQAGGAGP